MSDKDYGDCGGCFCDELIGHVDCDLAPDAQADLSSDDSFRLHLSEVLYLRKWGNAANNIADEALERLINELVEEVRRMP